MLLSVIKYHQNISPHTTDVLLRAVVGSITIINAIIIITTLLFQLFSANQQITEHNIHH